MKNVKYIWKSTLLKIMNGKIGTFLLILLVTSWTYDRPMKDFIQSVDYPVSWCLFPFFMASLGFLIFFWFGIIYVNSDVPFMQSVNMYHVVRAGRKRWMIGQIGGIFFRSLVLVMLTVICTILPLLPYIEWTNQWGKLLKTAAMSEIASSYHFKYMIYYEIFSEYTPIQLMVLCIFICTLVCTFLGVFMFVLCLYVNKICAVTVTAGWSVLLFFVTNQIYDVKYIAAFFVPTIWVEVSRMETLDFGRYWMPTILYMLCFLILGISVMSLLIMRKVKYMEFQWENEDM